MMLTKGAIGNLINRYSAVLKKCSLINTFGSLAVAGMLVAGGVSGAMAAETVAESTTIIHIADGEGTHNYAGETLSYSSEEDDAVVVNGGKERQNIKVNIGNNETKNIDVTAKGGIFVTKNGHVTLTAKNINLESTAESGSYAALWAQNNSVNTDNISENERASITINADKTQINSNNLGIVAMSNGIVTINGDLSVKAKSALLARGDAQIHINTSGTSAVQIVGDVEFSYHKQTSGTGIDATIDVNLNGKDSFWKGNTLISWDEKPILEKLNVDNFTLSVKDGARWIPTQFVKADNTEYTPLNTLKLDNGIVDVNKDVKITIEDIAGKGSITNAGSVTIEKGTIEGPITFVKGDANADNLVTVGKDGKTTLTGGVVGSGKIDKLAIAEGGETTITNANLSGHEGRALWNNGTLTVNGGRFEGNKAGNGGAVYMAGGKLTVENVVFKDNRAEPGNSMGGAVALGHDGNITSASFKDSSFIGNRATGAGGAISFANTAATTAANQKNLTLTNIDFKNNTSAGVGGAIRNYLGIVKFDITKDMTYSGNTAGLNSDGTFGKLYTDYGGFLNLQGGNPTNPTYASKAEFNVTADKTLTIGEESTKGSAVDSIASAHGTGTTITKSGTGTLTVNGSMKAYTGAIEVKEGTLNMATGFGEVSNGIQYRVNADKTGPAAVAGFAASEMTIADGANVNMGDLDITFSTFTNNNPTNTSLGNVGTKVSVQTNGSFKAGAVNVTKKTYTGAGEKNEQTVTTAGWGEFNIAESAKATIDSLTVNADGAKFDKTGAGVLHVGANDDGVITVGSAKAENAAELNVKEGELRANKLVLGSRVEGQETFATVNIGDESTDGTLVVNSIEDYNGTLTLTNGRLSVKDGWTIKATGQAKKNFNGGTLEVLGTGLDVSNLATNKALTIGATGDNALGSNLITTVLNAGSDTALTLANATTGKGFDKGVVTLFGDGKGNFLTANSLTIGTTGAAGIVNLGDSMEQHADKVKGGTTSAAITVTKGALNVTKGDWTTGALTQTGGTVALNGGNLTVASLTQTGTGKITVGGSSGKAQLTVTGDFKNKDASNSVEIKNLGTLSVKSDVVKKNSDTYSLDDANVKQINVAAGGTVKLGFVSGTELTTKNLGEIKNALDNNFKGLLDVGNAEIKNVTAGGTVDYTTVAGVTNESLKETTVKVDTSAAGSGVSGGFKDVVVSDDKVTEVKVTNTLVLAGSSTGGNLLQNSNNTVLGATVADNSALTLGVEDKANSGTVGAVSLGSSSALNAIGSGSFTVGSITTTASGAGTVSASAGSSLTVTGTIGNSSNYLSEVKAEGGNISVGGALHATTVSVTGGTLITDEIKMNGTGAAITVGSTDGGAGTLIAKTADLNGASLFLDPAWIEGKDYQDAALASRAAFEAFGTSGINGKITVGENSQLSLGTADVNWLTKSITDMGSSVWGAKGITAALGIYSPQTLDDKKGALLVDGKQKTNPTLTANTAEFRANSLLVVNAPNMLEKAALVGNGAASTLTVDKDAKLHIMGGKANDTVKIVSGFTAVSTIGGWSTNLTTDSKLLTANAGTLTSGAYDVTLSQNSTRSIFPKLDKNMAGLVDGMVRQIGLDPMSENYGQRFVSRAVSDSYIGSNNTKEAAATIEGAAKMALAGAVPQMGMNLANAAGNIAGLRNSLSAAPQGAVVALNADGTSAQEGLSAGDGMKNGLGLWVMPTYQNQQGFGFESGDFETGYKSNAAGVALGADYTFNDMFRVGAQFNVGGGYAESTGDFNSTDNRFNYWGLGLYAGYQYQNFGLTADFGYSANNNELEQSLPSDMQMAKLKADAKTDTITAGLRGEYKITTDALDIVPHIGVRMTNMHMDSFNVKSDKHKVFKADDMNATVWTFPVGVTFSKDIETSNGWTIKPSLDLAIIPAAGDIEAKQDVKIVGVNGTASMESNIMDAISYQGSLGLSAKNDNGVSVGVNYTLQASQHTTDHGVQATFRYEF